MGDCMANITVRNIPDELLNKIKTLSISNNRSLNSEILMVLEKELSKESNSANYLKDHISKDTQIKLWQNLCGRWKDN